MFFPGQSITSVRVEAVAFSMPWMDVGIAIMFVKPRPAAPSLLSFLSPFTVEVWIYTMFSEYIGKETMEKVRFLFNGYDEGMKFKVFF